MEGALPELVSLAQKSTQAMQKMTALAEGGTAEVLRSDAAKSGFAGRLKVANKMAAELLPIADELEAVAEGYEDQVTRIDAGMTCLLDWIEQDPSQLGQMDQFPAMIKEFVTAVHSANEAQTGLAESLTGPGKFSKTMRISTRRIVDATRRAAKALERADVWDARLQRIVDQAATATR